MRKDQATLDWCEELDGLAYAPLLTMGLFTHTTSINAVVISAKKQKLLVISVQHLKQKLKRRWQYEHRIFNNKRSIFKS